MKKIFHSLIKHVTRSERFYMTPEFSHLRKRNPGSENPQEDIGYFYMEPTAADIFDLEWLPKINGKSD